MPIPAAASTPLVGPLTLQQTTAAPLTGPNWLNAYPGSGSALPTSGPNGVYGTNATQTQVASWAAAVNTFTADQWVQATVSAIATGNQSVGVVVRGGNPTTNQNSWFSFTLGNNNWGILQAISNSFTTVSTATITPVANSVIALEIVGNNIRAFLNGAVVFNGPSPGTLATGQPGVTAYGVGNPPALINWSAGNGAYITIGPPVIPGSSKGVITVRTT
jgi:hypothetical protein